MLAVTKAFAWAGPCRVGTWIVTGAVAVAVTDDPGGANEVVVFHSKATGFGFHLLALARRDDFFSTSPPVFAVADVVRGILRPQEAGGLDASGDRVTTTVSR